MPLPESRACPSNPGFRLEGLEDTGDAGLRLATLEGGDGAVGGDGGGTGSSMSSGIQISSESAILIQEED